MKGILIGYFFWTITVQVLQFDLAKYIMNLQNTHKSIFMRRAVMNDKITEATVDKTDEMNPKKKPGRKPLSAEEKEAAAKLRAAEKEKADNLKPEIILQYQGGETDVSALVEAAKADFHSAKKRTLVTSLKLYIKPEESAAYYVINENHNGKIML